MPESVAQKVYNEIVAHMQQSGVASSNWYVGIASDPRNRLFSDHNVSEQNGHWIHRDTGSESAARAVEKAIIEQYRTQGDTGGGDASTRHVYAYVVTQNTRE